MNSDFKEDLNSQMTSRHKVSDRSDSAKVIDVDRPFSCDDCGKKFKIERFLKWHKTLMHAPQKELCCKIC